MEDLRIRITLNGPLGTPMLSGSLFGHFCWMIRLRHGEERLVKFLTELEANPLVFSDAMPAGHVPIPNLLNTALPPSIQVNRKLLNRRQFLPLEQFLQARSALNPAALTSILQGKEEPAALLPHRMAHNRINRLTGTTPDAGGLFFSDELWPNPEAKEFDIYIRGHHHGFDIATLFADMGEHGFGRDASTGRGRFRVLSIQPCPDLLAHVGNRWVSWSRGTHDPLMTSARYRLFTHYGKLGGLWATSTIAPFKRPITLWRAGATFSAPASKSIFGQLLNNVHVQQPDIIQNAWHFAVPFNEVES